MTADLTLLLRSVALTFAQMVVAALAANGQVGLPTLAGLPGGGGGRISTC